ncbi:30S ribosomal protein S16 [Candidatus Uhrbacteria bacterium]|jgi:small subunit ribosomal protein S16|nr:30S ribosomal protein S16 [Candidatus Uhrbacteria bacterium]
MLSIRLSRIGKKKQPIYRVIVTEKRRDPYGKFLEILGNYDPRSTDKKLTLKEDRVSHWLSVGAQPSDTVKNLLIREGLIKSDKKAKAVAISKKRQAKLDEKSGAAAEAAKEAEEAAAAKATAEAEAKAEAEAPAEAPAEEAPAEEPAKEEAPAEEAPKEAEKKTEE